MKSKRGFEFSFGWLFAILVGAAILILAIYGAVKFVGMGQYTSSSEVAKQLTIIFNPLETGLAEGKSNSAEINIESRIYNTCQDDGKFGKQLFSVSQKSFNKWGEKGADISVNNKYVFSDDVVEGKKFYFYSKPFKMPFKISEMIFFTSKNYCFIDAPEFVLEDTKTLKNIKTENCSSGDVQVCFSAEDCDINVIAECVSCLNPYEYGSVEKKNEIEYFTGDLMYAAIFSSPKIYECNFKRLMNRLVEISDLYYQESDSLSSLGCGSQSNLQALGEAARSAGARSLSGILNLKQEAEALDIENEAKSGCAIY